MISEVKNKLQGTQRKINSNENLTRDTEESQENHQGKWKLGEGEKTRARSESRRQVKKEQHSCYYSPWEENPTIKLN